MSETNEEYRYLLKKCYMGIDPSTVSTGYAIIDEDKNLITYGKITPSDKLEAHEKIKCQYDELLKIINEYKPVGICSEEQFGGANTNTLKKLSQVSGVVMLLAAMTGAEFTMKYPASWRKDYHGIGSVKKKDTVKKVNEMFSLDLKLTTDNDIADAIGMSVVAYQIGENN